MDGAKLKSNGQGANYLIESENDQAVRSAEMVSRQWSTHYVLWRCVGRP